jgi:glycosyltransferase involved in cell wall biosynthesis
LIRLDYVSPLPPVRSGIADYSVDLLPHLAARADVRLIRLPGQPVDEAIADAWPGVPLMPLMPLVAAEETGRDARGPRLPLYQMGNNRYHEGVLDLALRLPGVLTLHDIVLHHLLLDLTLGRGEFYPYRDRLTRDHGWIGRAAALSKRWGAYGQAPVFELPAHRALLRRQRGVLVHSRWAVEVIRDEDPEIRVRAVPMGVPLPPAIDDATEEAGRLLRRRFGLPEDGPVLGSFGFQTPIKRTLSVIRALARPGLERAHLLIVGEAAQGMDLEEEARSLGVAERVHITGFVPFEEFEAAIAAVDLCLNLRYPTAGETSASLLRVLAAGRPAVVSDYAQFSDLPAEVAVRVPLADDEPEQLAALLRDLLANPERLRAMGAAARQHVRTEHDPARAAAAVIEACEEWEELEPPGDLPAEGPDVARPSSLAWGRLEGEMEVLGAEAPWPEGERRRLRIRLANRGFSRWLAGERGPGGVAVVVKLFVDEEDREDLLAGRSWLALPRDVAPGEEIWLETEIRRPPGPAHLWIEPHLFGGLGFSKLGGPRWERRL